MIRMLKYILTGAPCNGKTTVINALSEEGYKTVPEAARIVIEEELAKNGNILPWIDVDKFQKAVLEKQLELESSLKEGTYFLDRGIPDGIAFYALTDVEAPNQLIDAAKRNRYDKVFLLEMLPFYKIDNERKHNFKESKMLHQIIKEVYCDLGYRLVEVPLLSVEERVKFIQKHL